MYFVLVNFILPFIYLLFLIVLFLLSHGQLLSYILITFLFSSMVYVQVFHMDDKRRVALEWELIFPLLLSSASILFFPQWIPKIKQAPQKPNLSINGSQRRLGWNYVCFSWYRGSRDSKIALTTPLSNLQNIPCPSPQGRRELLQLKLIIP